MASFVVSDHKSTWLSSLQRWLIQSLCPNASTLERGFQGAICVYTLSNQWNHEALLAVKVPKRAERQKRKWQIVFKQNTASPSLPHPRNTHTHTFLKSLLLFLWSKHTLLCGIGLAMQLENTLHSGSAEFPFPVSVCSQSANFFAHHWSWISKSFIIFQTQINPVKPLASSNWICNWYQMHQTQWVQILAPSVISPVALSLLHFLYKT